MFPSDINELATTCMENCKRILLTGKHASIIILNKQNNLVDKSELRFTMQDRRNFKVSSEILENGKVVDVEVIRYKKDDSGLLSAIERFLSAYPIDTENVKTEIYVCELFDSKRVYG